MKDFIIKKMIEKQMKNVTEGQKEKFMKLVTENPKLFQKMAIEIKKEMDSGKDQMEAMITIAKNHEIELKGLI